jgi:hypothetical protein
MGKPTLQEVSQDPNPKGPKVYKSLKRVTLKQNSLLKFSDTEAKLVAEGIVNVM